MTSHKFNFILATKKISTFVLKGVSYIALWKFTKSQDGENFLSVKNFQQVTNLILFQQPKKISTFVLKGASYIAFWKFSKSQDGENFPSPRIVKNFQQQIFNKFSTANFQKISTANFQKIFNSRILNTKHWTLWGMNFVTSKGGKN